MSSGGGKRILHRWVVNRVLPNLKQGSTLSIRSRFQTDLRIRSHWRDDGQLSFLQQRFDLPRYFDSNTLGQVFISKHEDKMTSLGQNSPHISIDILDNFGVEEPSGGDNDSDTRTLLPIPSPTTVEDENDGSVLTLDVPDKINIECDLTEGGSIFVESKIEGDVRLRTTQGNISVKKLRGHRIDLETASNQRAEEGDPESPSTPSFIFVSDVLESQSLRLAINRPSVDRIRAKRIHANTMEILAGTETTTDDIPPSNLTRHNESLFDDDDTGAICDIGSLYIIGDATVDIQQPSVAGGTQKHRQRQAVRIKSHHGHIHVQVTAPKPDHVNEMTGTVQPLVDLGGVNGSCEVLVSRPENDPKGAIAEEHWTSCHVHFDSIAPDSVSLLNADEGNIHVTVDRKVESDVRLLSPVSSGVDVDTEILLLEDNEDGSLADEVIHMLQEIEENAASNSTAVTDGMKGEKRILVQTQAFTARERIVSEPELRHCEFVDGWIENTTSEPDSRFDRKIRGNTGGGKIRLDGAQHQALHGFGTADNKGSGEAQEENSFARPLLVVSTPGKIVLETLSWLGNIARRYGLDESRDEDDLGRQATRRKGLGRIVPTNE